MIASQGDSATPLNWPVYWFFLLEDSLVNGDLEAAAKAVRRLKRLGVEVRYRRHPQQAAIANGLQEAVDA
jgi:hypothetical protein